MNELEFAQQAAKVFAQIEAATDNSTADIECSLNEGVMELEFENGSKIIINRHAPNQEIWVAAKSGGFHYAWKDGRWLNTRDGSELFSSLEKLAGEQAGEAVRFGGQLS